MCYAIDPFKNHVLLRSVRNYCGVACAGDTIEVASLSIVYGLLEVSILSVIDVPDFSVFFCARHFAVFSDRPWEGVMFEGVYTEQSIAAYDLRIIALSTIRACDTSRLVSPNTIILWSLHFHSDSS